MNTSDVSQSRDDTEFVAALAPWLTQQRWFPAPKIESSEITVIAEAPLGSGTGADFGHCVLTGPDGALFALPLSMKKSQGEHARAGAIWSGEIGTTQVDVGDATDELEERNELARLLITGPEHTTSEAAHPHISGGAHEATHTANLVADTAQRLRHDFHHLIHSERFDGEQSNTSLVLTAESGNHYMVKLYRQLQAGTNPDIELHEALQQTGNTQIAPYYGSISFTFGGETYDIAMINEFLPSVEDAWKVALVAAMDGIDFTERASALGSALASIHRDLATTLPTAEASNSAKAATLTGLEARLESFIEQVPELYAFDDSLRAEYAQALNISWPQFQRIHGDLHLGQVLDSPEHGWIFLDFEGEPMRPMSERIQLDSPTRDVAGVLRSIDYAAGYVALNDGIDATEWATHTREAFLSAYLDETTNTDAAPTREEMLQLIRVFELDKAAYECVYEARNRPEWLDIPLEALARLTA